MHDIGGRASTRDARVASCKEQASKGMLRDIQRINLLLKLQIIFMHVINGFFRSC